MTAKVFLNLLGVLAAGHLGHEDGNVITDTRYLVLEVGVDDLALGFVDELDESAQADAQIF